MATMHIRSTFAIDEPTALGLTELAKKWGVSKSEALRRAVARAREQPVIREDMTPHDALAALARKPLLARGQARTWRAENERARRESDTVADRRLAKRAPRDP
jgi:post-segregation antitoxin (ccd killing protein)